MSQNAVFTFPRTDFHPSKGPLLVGGFYDDPGHTEVKIDPRGVKTHKFLDKSTRNGRAIWIFTDLKYRTEWDVKNGIRQYN